MQPFRYTRPVDLDAAIAAANSDTMFLGGGTDVVQLMRSGVAMPAKLIDIGHLPDMAAIEALLDGRIRIGALARLADVAASPTIQTAWPLVAQALLLSASAQVRNVATLGGNLLQRTRCTYFRDASMACNKRTPGAGCPAIAGEHRNHALLGTSEHCIASHPSDLAVALTALDAEVHVRGLDGARLIRIADLYLLPGDTPQHETSLSRDEVIVAVDIPAHGQRGAHRGCYLKVRDRMSFEFAVVSLGCVLCIGQDGKISQAQLAAGGVGTKPWRLPQVEMLLQGERADMATFRNAAQVAGQGARPLSQNAFKLELLQRLIVRALADVSGAAQ